MKRLMMFLILLALVTQLASCGQTTLIIRTPLEGDNYIRNNIKNMDWETFETLLSEGHTVNKEEFQQLKNIIHRHPTTKYVLYPSEIFRFSEDGDILYLLTWQNGDNKSKLGAISLP